MIEWIRIQNYKRFDDFSAEGLKRVNLITGINNVGKTALLEAILILLQTTDNRSPLIAFKNILEIRKVTFIEIFNIIKYEIKISSEKLCVEIEWIEDSASDKEKQIFDATQKKYIKITRKDEKADDEFSIKPYLKVPYDYSVLERLLTKPITYYVDGKPNFENINFLRSDVMSSIQLSSYYSFVQKKMKKDELIDQLKIMDERIENIEVIIDGYRKNALTLQLDGFDELITSSELGEGINRFIALASALIKSENGALMIDEVENGIHWTKLKDMWKVILRSSKEMNVQVFAATHDNETIKALYEAAKELDDDDIAVIKLKNNDEGNVVSSTVDFEMIEYAVENGLDLRGW